MAEYMTDKDSGSLITNQVTRRDFLVQNSREEFTSPGLGHVPIPGIRGHTAWRWHLCRWWGDGRVQERQLAAHAMKCLARGMSIPKRWFTRGHINPVVPVGEYFQGWIFLHIVCRSCTQQGHILCYHLWFGITIKGCRQKNLNPKLMWL